MTITEQFFILKKNPKERKKKIIQKIIKADKHKTIKFIFFI